MSDAAVLQESLVAGIGFRVLNRQLCQTRSLKKLP